MAVALSRRVEQFARRSATAVRLEDLYRWGQGDFDTRLRMAKFLHREVAVRNAQLCKELRLLPFGLAETAGVSDIVACYSSYVDRLVESPAPIDEESEKRFTEVLRDVLEDHTQVVRTLGRGVLEVRQRLGEKRYDDIRSEVDLILDRFFIKRIGLRFLLQHHIESAEARPGVSGIIHSNVRVGRILRQAAADATTMCLQRYGVAPEVRILGDGDDLGSLSDPHGGNPNLLHNRQFTYVPTHLQFSCSVLLQNSCYAVAQRHANKNGELPPVYAIFAHGEEEVTVKVSDEGGGIPRSQIHLAWSYFDAPSQAQGPGPGRRHAAPLGTGNPPGAGLPLARLHARYYGGDLVLKSIEGFGTDAYFFLNRLGQNCENFPHGVRVSPAMRDSSVGDAASIQLDSLGTINELEAAFLRRRLRQYRSERQALSATLDSSNLP